MRDKRGTKEVSETRDSALALNQFHCFNFGVTYVELKNFFRRTCCFFFINFLSLFIAHFSMRVTGAAARN